MTRYLQTEIAESRVAPIDPRHAMTVLGYTKLRGAPTDRMVRLAGEKRWRRVMVWCFSNVGTLFVRVKGECLIVRDYDIPTPSVPRANATDPE